jgi:EAL domain-containing protein (putative c-di-GMP-specific phosphodiesterase class I)/GGDEF domain-containing protein
MSEKTPDCIEVPSDTLEQWQAILDHLCSVARIPAGLIMRMNGDEIEVFASSSNADNPYQVGQKESCHTELYCKTVIDTQKELLVSNALDDPEWDSNPDIALGMISYLGLPLNWPSGEVFGTICMLDKKTNCYNTTQKNLLQLFQKTIETNLSLLMEQSLLEIKIAKRTEQLQDINNKLTLLVDKQTTTELTIERQKSRDQETGLPNIHQIEAIYDREIKRGTINIGLLHLRIHNFISIRDRLGLILCNRLKVLIARKLTRLKIKDIYIGCLSEGEFGVLLFSQDEDYIDHSIKTAQMLSNKLQGKATIDSNTFNVAINIGLSFNDNNENFIDLLSQASVATSTSHEKNSCFEFYASHLQNKLSDRMQMEALMFNALENNEFHLEYQPFMESKSGTIVGAEALLRWESPVLGRVPPDKFISVAEHSGLIHELGYYVLRAAIEQIARWSDIYNSQFYIAVNLSPIQFKDSQLSLRVEQLLERYQVPASSLEVELTESIFFDDEQDTLFALEKMKEMGINISLDDFGTGYSSLSYLNKFPFNTVKIDRSFILDIENSEKSQHLVSAIISMANSLGLVVVAEGIENNRQANFVKSLSADICQGYFYGKPVIAEEFAKAHFKECFSSNTL